MHVAVSVPPGCLVVSLSSPDVLEVVIGIFTMASCHTFVVWGGHCECLKLSHRGGKKRVHVLPSLGYQVQAYNSQPFHFVCPVCLPVVLLPQQNTEASNGQGTIDDT